jgi:hypothetical protein
MESYYLIFFLYLGSLALFFLRLKLVSMLKKNISFIDYTFFSCMLLFTIFLVAALLYDSLGINLIKEHPITASLLILIILVWGNLYFRKFSKKQGL